MYLWLSPNSDGAVSFRSITYFASPSCCLLRRGVGMPQPNLRTRFAKLSLRFSFGNINNLYCQIIAVPAFRSMKLINFISMIIPIVCARASCLFSFQLHHFWTLFGIRFVCADVFWTNIFNAEMLSFSALYPVQPRQQSHQSWTLRDCLGQADIL